MKKSNILYILITLDVLKLDKSNSVSSSASSNIELIFVTLDVLKLDKSNPISPSAR